VDQKIKKLERSTIYQYKIWILWNFRLLLKLLVWNQQHVSKTLRILWSCEFSFLLNLMWINSLARKVQNIKIYRPQDENLMFWSVKTENRKNEKFLLVLWVNIFNTSSLRDLWYGFAKIADFSNSPVAGTLVALAPAYPDTGRSGKCRVSSLF
jgi:hypothetical protein